LKSAHVATFYFFSSDDVARFHLRNGAVFHSINWMGNPNLSGIQTSATMMVNYLYDLDKVEFNAKEFGSSNWQPPTSQKVRAIFDI
jgi:malonyl-CoA decarboxylase